MRTGKGTTGTGGQEGCVLSSLSTEEPLEVPSPATHCRWPQRDPALLRSGRAITCTQKFDATVCICMFLMNPQREKETQTNSNTVPCPTGPGRGCRGCKSLVPAVTVVLDGGARINVRFLLGLQPVPETSSACCSSARPLARCA